MCKLSRNRTIIHISPTKNRTIIHNNVWHLALFVYDKIQAEEISNLRTYRI